MFEGKRVVAGEAILNSVAISGRSAESSRFERSDELVESLVREHSRMVYRIAYAVLRRHHDAEDATQETFIRVLRYSSKLEAVENPKTWLARIAWNVALDRSKQIGKSREIPLEDPEKPMPEVASPESAIDEAVSGNQLGAILETMVAALPQKLRAPLILSTVEEMTPREIAATLGINEAAVRSRVFRARKRLKERLAQRESGR